MKKTKRLLAVTLSVAMIIGMAAGCGKKSDSSSKDEKGKTLEVWLPPLSENQDDKDVWDRILDPFEEENNCTVNVTIVPWSNYEEKYLTGVTSGEGPDVGYMYMEMIHDFIDMGAVEALDDYLTTDDKDNFLYLANGEIEGHQY